MQNIFNNLTDKEKRFVKIVLPILIVFVVIYLFKSGYSFGQWLKSKG